MKIYEDFYIEGFVFEKDKKYSGFWIGKMVDEIPLFYIINQNTIDLKNFSLLMDKQLKFVQM